MTPLVVLGIFKNISATYASIEEIFSQIVYCRDMIKVINAELPNSTNSREIMKQKSKGVKMTPLVVLVLNGLAHLYLNPLTPAPPSRRSRLLIFCK